MSALQSNHKAPTRPASTPRLGSLFSLFVFAVLLYLRPALRIASVTPHRVLRVHDALYNAAHFVFTDAYTGSDFLKSWTWLTFDDPTHGRVNYVNQTTAQAKNLAFVSKDKFIMRADYQQVVQPGSRGRDSVRIQSNKAYNESITILDLQHMPEGCATWPAFWSLSQNGPWPHGGEIDIIEGVNNNPQNLASLHTTPQCTMPDQPQRDMTGTVTSTNCDSSVNYNQGCGVNFDQPMSYGSAFNAADGGYYVMVRKTDSVRIWFWPRYHPFLPIDIRLDPHTWFSKDYDPSWYWGKPAAEFPTREQCDYNSHFDDHAFVFDLTFCGDWAGTAYSTSGCPSASSCNDFVDNNPEAFYNAYWEINGLYVFTPQSNQ